MPKTLPQYAYRERNRHGKSVYYFRKGKGRRTRLPAFGTDAFENRYHELLTALEPPKAHRSVSGTLDWLVARYQETAAYHALSSATRRQRDNIFKGVLAKSGNERIAALNRKSIEAGKESRRATPAQARHFLNAMRGLFKWAKGAKHASTDPTEGVEKPTQPRTDGFPAWTDADVALYEAHWPAGTRERVWMHVLLYTGLRRGDAVVLGKQHMKQGVATLKTEKTGTEVSIPIRPTLARTVAEGPVGDLAFIVGERGQPLTKESFGNFFRDACNAAGVKKSAHGLRKLAATKAAEAGATVNQMEAWFGWEGGGMASHYTKRADRQRLAAQLGEKMENAVSPHLADDRPAPEKSAR